MAFVPNSRLNEKFLNCLCWIMSSGVNQSGHVAKASIENLVLSVVLLCVLYDCTSVVKRF